MDLFSFIRIYFFINLAHVDVISSTKEPNHSKASYESFYLAGVSNYLENNWQSCASNFEEAIKAYHWWNENVIRCRKLCSEENDRNLQKIFANLKSSEHNVLKSYGNAIFETYCLVKCRRKNMRNLLDFFPSTEVQEAFRQRKPYDYLQLCYFKLDRLKDAADAAATVLANQNHHKVMQDNLIFYLNTGLNESDVEDLESGAHQQAYKAGVEAYSRENFVEAIEIFEIGLSNFLEALDDCRILCDNPLHGGFYTDFVSLVANAFTYTLRCKRLCYKKLSQFVKEDEFEDYIKTVIHFLQFSYNKVENFEKSCEAIETGLYLDPDSSVFNRNKHFMITLPDIREEYFVVRDKVRDVYDRETAEKKLLEMIEQKFILMSEENFVLEDETFDSWTGNLIENRQKSENQAGVNGISDNGKESSPNFENIKLTKSGKELNGDTRFIADGFLTSKQCDQLIWVAKQASVEGDGYRHSENPHTTFEKFEGINVSRLSLLAYAGYIDATLLKNILDVSDNAKNYLQSHFKLNKTLEFSYTHLVCREAKIDMQNRSSTDWSHAVHADNCLLQPDGICLSIPPAYTFRDYSAVLYLNDNFEGGEFIFTKDATGKVYDSIVEPKCGRLVGFSAGFEDSHGVRAVTRGARCALPLWFTYDKKYREIERDLAYKVVEKIKNEGNQGIEVKDEL